tara:strand:- start:1689 stop:2069 length:381 start_codon:yes stop_codon:yes gene_type:complete
MARILVIDDDLQVRAMLRGILEDEGYEVEVASNGRSGIQQYLSDPCDLVIADIVMPEMEGVEVINLLQKCVPTPKIIAISGGSRDTSASQNLQTAEQLGACISLKKPVTYDALVTAVQKSLLSAGP